MRPPACFAGWMLTSMPRWARASAGAGASPHRRHHHPRRHQLKWQQQQRRQTVGSPTAQQPRQPAVTPTAQALWAVTILSPQPLQAWRRPPARRPPRPTLPPPPPASRRRRRPPRPRSTSPSIRSWRRCQTPPSRWPACWPLAWARGTACRATTAPPCTRCTAPRWAAASRRGWRWRSGTPRGGAYRN